MTETNQDILKDILNEIHNLKSEISTIKQEIVNISKSTSNMDTHISFVESVWTVVKNPFSNILQLYYGTSKTVENINDIHIQSSSVNQITN